MTTVDSWHLPDGVKIWAAPRLRQPYVDMHERDGPLRVVLLADYEALARLFDEAVDLLKGAQNPRAAGNEDLDTAITRILAAVA
jgi:hypothetical protein